MKKSDSARNVNGPLQNKSSSTDVDSSGDFNGCEAQFQFCERDTRWRFSNLLHLRQRAGVDTRFLREFHVCKIEHFARSAREVHSFSTRRLMCRETFSARLLSHVAGFPNHSLGGGRNLKKFFSSFAQGV